MASLPPIGKRGAAAALKRLETAEERAHARLEAALACGDQLAIQACQDFSLKCSETGIAWGSQQTGRLPDAKFMFIAARGL
jgi:hypothetical protein